MFTTRAYLPTAEARYSALLADSSDTHAHTSLTPGEVWNCDLSRQLGPLGIYLGEGIGAIQLPFAHSELAGVYLHLVSPTLFCYCEEHNFL